MVRLMSDRNITVAIIDYMQYDQITLSTNVYPNKFKQGGTNQFCTGLVSEHRLCLIYEDFFVSVEATIFSKIVQGTKKILIMINNFLRSGIIPNMFEFLFPRRCVLNVKFLGLMSNMCSGPYRRHNIAIGTIYM